MAIWICRVADEPHGGVRDPTEVESDLSPDARVLRGRWAELIKTVYEVD